MFIFNQDRTKLINLDNVLYLDIDELGKGNTNCIYANFEYESPVLLGVYITPERVEDILNRIAERQGAIHIFYMPKGEVDDD